METIYDWLSMAVFAGLVILFLHRSVGDAEPRDHLIQYIPPAVGCAFANWVGNEGLDKGNASMGVVAGCILLAVVAYILHILKPFSPNP